MNDFIYTWSGPNPKAAHNVIRRRAWTICSNMS